MLFKKSNAIHGRHAVPSVSQRHHDHHFPARARRQTTDPPQKQKEAIMKTAARFNDFASGAYVITVLAVLGVFSVITAILIAWPALAYIGSKFF